MIYRYVVRKNEWENNDSDWQQLVDYARARFSHTVIGTTALYFNTTPEQLRQAVNTLRIGTTGFDILTTSKLEPSIHKM